LEWLLLGFADIVKLIRDDKRTAEQLQPLKDAIQAVIDGRSVQVVFTETIKDLCLSSDPAKIRQGWQQLYQQWQLSLEIPEVPYGTKRIQVEKKRGRILIFVWETLADKAGLPTLGRLFPKMNSWATKADSGITVDSVLSGWMFVKSSLDAPDRNTTEAGLRDAFTKQNATGLTLNAYIIFGQFCREVFGSYPDIKTWSRLLGSSYGGDLVSARFNSDGFLRVDPRLSPEDAYDRVGGRSAAV